MSENEYALNETEQAVVEEALATIREVQCQLQGVLRLIVRQNKLEGNWTLDGRKLIKAN